MMTWANILFYVIFLSQILLISFYFPRVMLGRMKHVLETYPPSKYPRLYPKPIEYYKIGHWAYKLVNQLVVLLGFVVLFLIANVVDHGSFADDGFISEAWPMAYGMIQFVPLIMLELTGHSQFKLMRKANTTATRKAELRRRRLFDFVSPVVVGLAVLSYLGAILLDLYVHQFDVDWGHDTVQRALWLTVGNLVMAGFGVWHLFGRKQDPHQASEDRTTQIGAQLGSLFYVSIAMSIFFMTVAADDVYELDFLDATLLSLYFQVIAFFSIGHVLRSINLDDIDFDVYKNDTAVT